MKKWTDLRILKKLVMTNNPVAIGSIGNMIKFSPMESFVCGKRIETKINKAEDNTKAIQPLTGFLYSISSDDSRCLARQYSSSLYMIESFGFF